MKRITIMIAGDETKIADVGALHLEKVGYGLYQDIGWKHAVRPF
ncbi:hypothetical protein MHB45_25605 [Peribacillus sp. FSL K6-5616]